MSRGLGGTVRRLVVLAALVVAGLACSLAPAAADAGALLVDVPGDAVGFTHDPGAPLIRVERLSPGRSGAAVFDVRNTSAEAVRLALSVVDLVDEENGCVVPEMRDPGEECDADGGELSDQLTASISRDDQPDAVLWSGAFRDLVGGAGFADALPAGATWTLRITVAMSEAATNATMTDSVSFGTRLAAESAAGGYSVVGSPIGSIDGEPSGQQVGAPGGERGNLAPGSGAVSPLALGPSAGLPVTGSTISLWMVVLDAALLLAGVALVSLSRRRPALRHSRSRARRTRLSASVWPTPRARTFSANS